MDAETPAPGSSRSWLAPLLLLLVPGLFLGSAFAPDRVLLPVHPVAFEPLASVAKASPVDRMEPTTPAMDASLPARLRHVMPASEVT